MTITEWKVFYSWQSELLDETNRGLIRAALGRAIADLNLDAAQTGALLLLDEATRGEPGSPNIPETIRKKIDECAIVVADVSTVNPKSDSRLFPNANVSFELGYAAAMVGWPRTILIGNEAFGTAKDLPFDFDRHRAMFYTAGENWGKDRFKSVIAGLAAQLKSALTLIVHANPRRPAQERGLSESDIKRQRDLENLRSLLSILDLGAVDSFIEEGPGLMRGSYLSTAEEFIVFQNQAIFHIHSKELAETLGKLTEALRQTISMGQFYETLNHSADIYRFMQSSLRRDKAADSAWTQQEQSLHRLKIAVDEFATYINENFLELNLRELSRAAAKRYMEGLRAAAKRLEL